MTARGGNSCGHARGAGRSTHLGLCNLVVAQHRALEALLREQSARLVVGGDHLVATRGQLPGAVDRAVERAVSALARADEDGVAVLWEL